MTDNLTFCSIRADAKCCQLLLHFVTRQLLKLVHNDTNLQVAAAGEMRWYDVGGTPSQDAACRGNNLSSCSMRCGLQPAEMANDSRPSLPALAKQIIHCKKAVQVWTGYSY
jgi:hypothetical protein